MMDHPTVGPGELDVERAGQEKALNTITTGKSSKVSLWAIYALLIMVCGGTLGGSFRRNIGLPVVFICLF